MFQAIARLIGLAAVVAVASMVGFVLLKTPSHDRNWKTEHARLPVAEFEEQRVTVRNVRNFSYNPDGGIREAEYFDHTYDLGKVTELWYGISHFYGYGLAHTFLSFGFADGARLVLSIEARQEIGETYRPLTGLFRNYELIFVIADERDVIGVRTHVRGERVYLYRIKANLEYIRRFLRIMLDRVNGIQTRPEFYNTIIDNCMTGILEHVEGLSWFDIFFDYRVLLPGYSDEVAYELGILVGDGSLAELRAAARLDPARTAIDDQDFSDKIRRGRI